MSFGAALNPGHVKVDLEIETQETETETRTGSRDDHVVETTEIETGLVMVQCPASFLQDTTWRL